VAAKVAASHSAGGLPTSQQRRENASHDSPLASMGARTLTFPPPWSMPPAAVTIWDLPNREVQH